MPRKTKAQKQKAFERRMKLTLQNNVNEQSIKTEAVPLSIIEKQPVSPAILSKPVVHSQVSRYFIHDLVKSIVTSVAIITLVFILAYVQGR